MMFYCVGLLPLKVVSMASRGTPLRWMVGRASRAASSSVPSTPRGASWGLVAPPLPSAGRRNVQPAGVWRSPQVGNLRYSRLEVCATDCIGPSLMQPWEGQGPELFDFVMAAANEYALHRHANWNENNLSPSIHPHRREQLGCRGRGLPNSHAVRPNRGRALAPYPFLVPHPPATDPHRAVFRVAWRKRAPGAHVPCRTRNWLR